jgi:LmbE family N-acetylglucosaminyl deacetylase
MSPIRMVTRSNSNKMPLANMTKNNLRRSFATVFILSLLALALASRPDTFRSALAQEPASTSTIQKTDKAELHQALLDLTNSWTVMCVAAHPDDEDGTTLTVLRRRDGAHTVSLFSTYGEGGQNAVGPELYEELGVIRVHETMKAAQIQGSEPYFLGLKDFGFSKSAAEAFKFWGHDEALRRMVLKLRQLRPDVIITNHDTTSGHGHHQATGRLIIEAFDAAADPKRFPEQLATVKPWQAQRLFVRIFGGPTQTPAASPASEESFAIDPNETDPIRGTSFAEQALAALQQHATQGPWPKTIAEMLRVRRIEGGKTPLTRYRLIRAAPGVPPLPANATSPLAGLELPEQFTSQTTPPQVDGQPLTKFLDRPDRVLATLIDWRAAQPTQTVTRADPDRYRLFAARADRALAIASGVSLTLSSREPVLVPGLSQTFLVNLANAGLSTVQITSLKLETGRESVPLETTEGLLPDTETTVTVARTTPKNAPLTVPNEEHLYDNLFLGQPVAAVANLEIDGAKFSVSNTIMRDVAPAVELKHIWPSPYVWTPATLSQPLSFTVTVTNNLDTPFNGNLTIGNPQSHIFATGRTLTLAPRGTSELTLKSNALPVDTPSGRVAKQGELLLSVEPDGARTAISERPIKVIFSAARIARGLRVGFVPSFDQTIPRALTALGVSAQELKPGDIQNADLSTYTTIIIDNRGYEAHPELIAANPRLLEFVNAGGTLIVFYHKSNEWNPDPNRQRPQLAPYPIVLGNERVTDETAPIRFLVPGHPLLRVPNRITQLDFANWIQERGLYYPKQWDAHYTALFASHDPGEEALNGGLLVAAYGKGNYIYTSMVWYRELRAGVPGAYRMFANMISYGHR